MTAWRAYIAGIGTAGALFGFIAVCRNLERDNDDEE